MEEKVKGVMEDEASSLPVLSTSTLGNLVGHVLSTGDFHHQSNLGVSYILFSFFLTAF